MGREHAIAYLRAARAAHGPARTPAGHFQPGHSGNRSGKPKGHLPRQQPPTLVVRDYQRVLRERIARVRRAFAPLLAELPGLLAAAARERSHRHDAYNPDQPRDDFGRWVGEGGETSPRTSKEAASRIATAIDKVSAGRSGYPGKAAVEKNWAKKINTANIPAHEFDTVDRALHANATNTEFQSLKERFGPEVVVLSNHFENGGRGRAERLGTTTLVYHSPTAPLKSADDVPSPGAATTEQWGGTAAVLRHEYGHSVYDQIVRGGRAEEWHAIKHEEPSTISRYAAAKDDELFAETLAVVTDRNYDPAQWGERERRYFEDFRALVGLPRRRGDALPTRVVRAFVSGVQLADADAADRAGLVQGCACGGDVLGAGNRPRIDQTTETLAEFLGVRHGCNLPKNASPVKHRDAGEGRRVRQLAEQARAKVAAASAQPDIEAIAAEFAAKTSTHQRIQLNRQTRAALGVDAPLTDQRTAPLIEAFIDSNVGLIKNISDKVAADIEAIALNAIQTGKLWEDVSAELEGRFAFGEARSNLIPRDQIGKLNGQLNAARQREMGVKRFRWKVVDDERVRGRPDGKYPDAEPSHWAFKDKIYSYDDPPEGMLPGEDYQCRCYAEAIFDDILAELDDL